MLPATRTLLDLGELTIPESTERVEVSPDGSRFAVVGITPEGRQALFIRNSGEERFRIIDGTDGAFDPTFSPDGESLLYEGDDGTLMRVPVGGGQPRPVVPAGDIPNTPLWTEEGIIFFSGRDGLYGVSDAGGQPELLYEGATSIYPMALLPNGNLVATDRPNSRTVVVDLEADSMWVLIPDGVNARYLDSGHLLYADITGGLWAVAFDADRGELAGEPILLFDDLEVRIGYYARYAISENGTLVYSTGVSGGNQELVVVGMDESVQVLPLSPRPIEGPRWSPDGRAVAYGTLENIYTYDVALGSTPVQLTSEGINFGPEWSPDGAGLAFSSNRTGTDRVDVVTLRINEESPPEVSSAPRDQHVTHWPSQDLLVFEGGGLYPDLFTLNLATDSAAPYLTSEFSLRHMRVSPNGDLATYTSNETAGLALTSEGARIEVFVRAFPVPGPGQQVSAQGGRFPRWSRDGSTIFYWAGNEGSGTLTLVSARVRSDPALAVTQRDTILSLSWGGMTGDDWDLHPDEDRFIITRSAGFGESSVQVGPARGSIFVVTNWFTELRALMGEGTN